MSAFPAWLDWRKPATSGEKWLVVVKALLWLWLFSTGFSYWGQGIVRVTPRGSFADTLVVILGLAVSIAGIVLLVRLLSWKVRDFRIILAAVLLAYATFHAIVGFFFVALAVQRKEFPPGLLGH
jgi:hypothetical protein